MAIKEYVGAVMLEVDGREVECASYSVTKNTGMQPVKTMNRSRRIAGFSTGVATFEITAFVPIPMEGDEIDWFNCIDVKMVIYPSRGTGKRTAYTGCVVQEVSHSYDAEGEAKRDVKLFAVDRVEEQDMENIIIKGELPSATGARGASSTASSPCAPSPWATRNAWRKSTPSSGTGGLAVHRLPFACALQSLGIHPEGAITPELLAGLPAQDFAALSQAEEDLAKNCGASTAGAGQTYSDGRASGRGPWRAGNRRHDHAEGRGMVRGALSRAHGRPA